ncbi:MAG: hypothetical protein WA618_03740, partial [Terriglobales bacterium]
HYTAAVQSFPIDANLQSGIYDAGRDLYYFADQAQIQVLSRTDGKWISPIPLPGTSGKTQLLAISESPDGTKLAVSDLSFAKNKSLRWTRHDRLGNRQLSRELEVHHKDQSAWSGAGSRTIDRIRRSSDLGAKSTYLCTSRSVALRKSPRTIREERPRVPHLYRTPE